MNIFLSYSALTDIWLQNIGGFAENSALQLISKLFLKSSGNRLALQHSLIYSIILEIKVSLNW
jgi:hypothetical protein